MFMYMKGAFNLIYKKKKEEKLHSGSLNKSFESLIDITRKHKVSCV